MSRKVKSKLTGGKPIIFDFVIDDSEITYEMICPKCNSKNFVISIDKSRIACNDPDCITVILLQLKATETDTTKEVSWDV